MPDDRFADLRRPRDGEAREQDESRGDGAPPVPSAADQLAALDDDDRAAPPPAPRRPATSYTWVVGVLSVFLIVYVGFRTLPHAGAGSHGPAVGRPIPRFAAVTALGPATGTPNVKQSRADSAQTNRTPACDVHAAGVVTSCELVRKPLVLTFVGPGTTQCNRYLDRIERLLPAFPSVAFAAVVSFEPKRTVAALVRRHRWTFPVVVDSNHVLFDRYSIAVCATTAFAYRGGTVRADAVLAQKLSDARLRADIRAIASGGG